MYEQSYTFSFEAAHELSSALKTDADGQKGAHPYARLHGQSFVVTITLRTAELSGPGWVEDFAAVRAACEALKEKLDHRLLNDVPGLGAPTLERLAAWIHRELSPALPALARVEAARPTLSERVAYEPR